MKSCLLLAIAACFGFVPSNEGDEPVPAPTTFYIVRHADREGSEDALTEAGNKRAEALREFMIKQGVGAVYSTKTKRTQATAKPTANAAAMEIAEYPAQPNNLWFTNTLKKHPGQAVLIVGHSNTIVPIANGFGGRIKHEVGHDDYHDMFIVRVHGGLGQTVRINYGHVPATKKTVAPKTNTSNAPKTKEPVKP